MSAALECWSGRPSTDEDTIEQVLMKSHHRSDPLPSSSSSPPPPQKKWHRLLSSLKETNLVRRTLTQLLPTNQFPPNLVSDLHRHFASLPASYSQSGFDMKDFLLHLRLSNQSASSDSPAFRIHHISSTLSKLTFVCAPSFSWPALSAAIQPPVLRFTKAQIFEKRGLVLGVVTAVIRPGDEKQLKSRVDYALRSASRKPTKLPFSLCGCQLADNADSQFNTNRANLPNPLPESSLVVSVDEWQTAHSWVLDPEEVEFAERAGNGSFRGWCRGKRVWIRRLGGCEVEIRQDLVQLMSCGQRNLLQFCGVCMHDVNGMCVVTRLMEGGSVDDLIRRSRRVSVREVMRIALDVAEGLRFMNSYGVAYRDLNRQRVLLDREGNACLGDMGVVASCMRLVEGAEYETGGYRWLAPEVS